MKRLLLALILTGCAQQDRPVDAAVDMTLIEKEEQPAKLTCEPFNTNTAKLKAALKSRNEWKAYAERLQLLLPPDSPHESYP